MTSQETLHATFLEQARRCPKAVAVVALDRTLDYATLAAEAAAVAASLHHAGVRRGAAVGVLLERDSRLIPALLGVQMAGAAYVPLDPAYPPSRIRTLLDDCRPTVVISTLALYAQLGSIDSPCLPLPEGAVGAPPADEAGPRDAAYFIYTSGSTGKPKGVVIEHRAAMDMLEWAAAEMPPSAIRRTLASTSVCFDLSIFEIFLPLVTGHTVVLERNILDWHERGSPGEVTLVNTVPSALASVVSAGGLPASVEIVNVAGEPLPAALVEDTWRGQPWLAAMYNLYGPSEDTTYSTFTRVAPRLEVTIGRPLPRTEALVMAADGRPAADGEPGELWLAGAGLARGYWARPDLTAERFVPHPGETLPGSRAYRTGDVVRRRPDGNLEFLGRLDDQLKLRGFRIEPGEIAAELERHPAVATAVVLAMAAPGGDRRLVAYVSRRDVRDDTDACALDAHVRTRLPVHMCPQAYVWMERWPLTPNGKIDRKALAPPDWTRDAAAIREASDSLEACILHIWQEVIGTALGPDDDFFAVGGDSLIAMRIASRMREMLKRHISLASIFQHPTVAGLAATLRASPESATVPDASFLFEECGRTTEELSLGEERLYFLQQLEPESAKYNMAYAHRFRGELDTSLLAASLEELTARHAVLRVGFAMDGHPKRIHADSGPPLVYVHANSEDQLLALVAEHPLKSFEVGVAPLWRASLIRRHARDHTLVVSMHHAISDAWSIDLLFGELATIYNAHRRGVPHGLAEVVPYADYIRWQRSRERQAVYRSQLAYWVDRLRGAAELNLPIARLRPERQSADGALHRFEIPAPLAARLERLKVREGVSTFMLLLAAWNVLLHRLSGQLDICVGTPVSDRTDARFEHTVGYFLNVLVLRSDLSGDPSFLTLLARVRDATLEAFAHQDVPFDDVVRVLEPVRNLRRTPLTQSALVVQAAGPAPCQLDGTETTCEELFTPTTKFDLSLFVTERMPGIEGWWAAWEYSTALFDPAAMAALEVQWLRLLEAIAENPNLNVGSFDLMAEGEERRRILDISRGPVPHNPPMAIHDRIAVRAAVAPEAIAVEYEGECTSYRQLEAAANRLAHTLLGQLGPGQAIALDLPRGPMLVQSMLGVLKTGGSYVPLDPATPSSRIASMLERSAVVAVIRASADVATTWHGLPVFGIDACADAPASAPAIEVTGDHAAYVMHTSGSTGEPKAVIFPHRALDTLVSWYGRTLPQGRRMLQFAPPHFDMASLEIFATLAGGGTLVTFDQDVLNDPATLAQLIDATGIEQLYLPVVMLDLLAREWGDGTPPRALLDIVTAGEALVLTPAIRNFLRRHACALCNQYGPTETHVAAAYRLDPALLPVEDWPERPPIGRAIDGARCYVLDAYGQLCPTGTPGELFIGGACVGLGYAGRPDLTAERFLPDPLADTPGARMYRTGDRARIDEAGQLVFLGRLDRQVKIRGHRVEPGEVESALLADSSVAQALVVAHAGQSSSGDAFLAAYVVPRGTTDTVALRRRLANTLPSHLIPSHILVLDALPLTANGKVDTARLPSVPVVATASATRATPRTATEEKLAQLWCQILGLEEVGTDTHFFECGGNSFSAMRLVAAMQQVFGLRVPLHVVFTLPTIATCAAAIDARRTAPATA